MYVDISERLQLPFVQARRRRRDLQHRLRPEEAQDRVHRRTPPTPSLKDGEREREGWRTIG